MPKILIAEDEYVIARGIQSNLEGWGYDVTGIATSGEGAIASAASDRPDLVLMDIVLKGDMDGIAAAATIVERFNIPVVYVTAFGSDPFVQRAKTSAPFGYIVKPFSDRALHSAIEIALHLIKVKRMREHLIQRLESFSERLTTDLENQHQRIAIDLHENAAQLLSALNLQLCMVEKSFVADQSKANLENAMRIAEHVLRQVCGIASELYPLRLNSLGLPDTLCAYASAQGKAAGWLIHVDAPKLEVPAPLEVELACFRVLQEALSNILRHAQASEVWVRLRQSADELSLCIRDNGKGFDINALPTGEKRMNLGLLGLEQRAKHKGGMLEINSTPGAGTEVRAVFRLDSVAE